MVTRALFALVLLATTFLTSGSGSPQTVFPKILRLWQLSSGSQQLEVHHRPQEDESQVKEFKGKILKSAGKFVLEESSTAKKYDGQRVVVTGTLDATHNTIHVRKIEAVA